MPPSLTRDLGMTSASESTFEQIPYLSHRAYSPCEMEQHIEFHFSRFLSLTLDASDSMIGFMPPGQRMVGLNMIHSSTREQLIAMLTRVS